LLGERGLTDIQRVFEVAHAGFPSGKPAQQDQAVRVGQNLEQPAGAIRRGMHRIKIQLFF
jgi:hypothetical protein